MDIAFVKARLQKMLSTARALATVEMVGCLLAGLLVLYVSFWASYGVIWFLSFTFFRLDHHVLLLIAGAFMTLVIIVGAKQNRQGLEPLERQVGLARDMDITLSPWTRYGMSYNTNAMKAGAFEIRSLASVINWILCGGVLLVLASLRKLRQYRRLKTVDVDECARVVALLYAAARRLSFEEIVQKLSGLNPVKVFDDLRCLEAVLFLSNEPPGLTLHPEMKADLNRLANPP